MIYRIAAILILAAFYGIYIGKMLMQRRKGIQTDQIAKGSRKDKTYYIELIMKIATYSVVIVSVISIIFDWSWLSISARFSGFVIGVLGVVIFGAAVWTMRDSWRAGLAENDKTEMITEGIYQFSRNPAFLGFDLMYLGVLLLFFNPLLLIFSLFAGVMLHLQILQEEKYLSTVFGKEYEEYCGKVCRYLGRKS